MNHMLRVVAIFAVATIHPIQVKDMLPVKMTELPSHTTYLVTLAGVNLVSNQTLVITVGKSLEDIKTAQAQAKFSVQTVPQPTYTVPSDSHTNLVQEAGIALSQFPYIDYIISHESGWRVNAQEPSTHAYGLPQSLPASKMASAGSDWLTNPITQLKWANSYAISRYGSWYVAYLFWKNHHWW